MEDFHSQTERGVKQELYGHVLLISIARIFESDAKNISTPDNKKTVFQSREVGGSVSNLSVVPPFKINFKNGLAVVGRHLENLILAPKQLIETWLYKTMQNISKIRQRVRPDRSYPRISFKPRNRWNTFRAVSSA